MERRDELLASGLRYDPQERRQSVRKGRERGAWVYIPKAELLAAGVDPNRPPPTYAISTSPTNPGAVHLRFYR